MPDRLSAIVAVNRRGHGLRPFRFAHPVNKTLDFANGLGDDA